MATQIRQNLRFPNRTSKVDQFKSFIYLTQVKL